MLNLLTFISGCSTFATISGGNNPNKFNCRGDVVPRVYSGIFNDFSYLKRGSPGNGIVLVDLPFSFIADTVVVPYTIYTQLRYGNLCNSAPEKN